MPSAPQVPLRPAPWTRPDDLPSQVPGSFFRSQALPAQRSLVWIIRIRSSAFPALHHTRQYSLCIRSFCMHDVSRQDPGAPAVSAAIPPPPAAPSRPTGLKKPREWLPLEVQRAAATIRRWGWLTKRLLGLATPPSEGLAKAAVPDDTAGQYLSRIMACVVCHRQLQCRRYSSVLVLEYVLIPGNRLA